MKKNILSLAALLIASATFVACSNDDNIIGDQPVQPTEQVYTLSVSATKGGDEALTRALSLDDKTLNASWAEGEEVTVYNDTKKALLSGTLTAQSSGASTTLKGKLTGTIENGDNLILCFNGANYASQKGTLDYIAANCDFAKATITVSSVDGENNVTPASAASFENQQAIVKFIIKDKDGNDLNVSKLTISAESNRLVSAVGLQGDKIYHTGYIAESGIGDYGNLLDGDIETKWYTDASDGTWHIYFQTPSPIWVDGYTLTTAEGRNPKNWSLMAKQKKDDSAWWHLNTKTNYTDWPAAFAEMTICNKKLDFAYFTTFGRLARIA